MNREICYQCPFQGLRCVDFTMADYWGVEEFHPEIKKEAGVSLLSVNSEKAKAMLPALINKGIFLPSEVKNAAKYNSSLVGLEERPIPEIRSSIYNEVKNNGWYWVSTNRCRPKQYYLYKIWYSLPKGLADKLKFIFKG